MLSKWETLFLLLMTIPIMGHVVILPLLLDVAGRDAWIAIIVSLPPAFIFAYAIYKIKKIFPAKSVNDIILICLGKWTGAGLIVIFVLYFLFLTILSFAALVDFVYIVFLPETPRVAIALWFCPFFIYAALKGVKRIALTASLLTFIAMITGHVITLLNTPKKDWNQLLPLLEYGWNPVFIGALALTSIWMELLLLLCVPIKNLEQKCFFLLWVVGILLNGLMMFSTTTGVTTVFGLAQADNFVYPAEEIVRYISLGFIDRFDVYGLILMLFGVYIRCSLYSRLAYDLAKPLLAHPAARKFCFGIMAAVIFLATLFIANERFRLDGAMIVYTYFIALYPIPFVLLLLSHQKKKAAIR